MLLKHLNAQKSHRTDDSLEKATQIDKVNHNSVQERSVSADRYMKPANKSANMFAKVVKGTTRETSRFLQSPAPAISTESTSSFVPLNMQRPIPIRVAQKAYTKSHQADNERVLAINRTQKQVSRVTQTQPASTVIEDNEQTRAAINARLEFHDHNDPVFTIPINTHKVSSNVSRKLDSFDPAKSRRRPVTATKYSRASSAGVGGRSHKVSADYDFDGSRAKCNAVRQTLVQGPVNSEPDVEENGYSSAKVDEMIEKRLADVATRQNNRWEKEKRSNQALFKVCHFRTSKGVRVKRTRPRTASVGQTPTNSSSLVSCKAAASRPSTSETTTIVQDRLNGPRTGRSNSGCFHMKRLRSFDSSSGKGHLDARVESSDTLSTALGNATISDIMRTSVRPSTASVINVTTFLESSRPTSANVSRGITSQKQRPGTAVTANSSLNSSIAHTRRPMSHIQVSNTTANNSFDLDFSSNRLGVTGFPAEQVAPRPISGKTINDAEIGLGVHLEEIPEDQSVKDERLCSEQKTYSEPKTAELRRNTSQNDISSVLQQEQPLTIKDFDSEDIESNASEAHSKSDLPQQTETVVATEEQVKPSPSKPKKHQIFSKEVIETGEDVVEFYMSLRQKNKELRQELRSDAKELHRLKELGIDIEDDMDDSLSELDAAKDVRIQQGPLPSSGNKIKTLFAAEENAFFDLRTKIEELEYNWHKAADKEEAWWRYLEEKRANEEVAQDDWLRGSTARLTVHELSYLREEFKKPRSEVNYQLVDTTLKRLKFFLKMHVEVRIALLKEAALVSYKKGETIFKMGDYGDLMYIILYGTCLVKIPQKTLNPGQLITVASLSDGSHFGELAMMGAKTRKQGTVDLHEIKSLHDVPKYQEDERKKKQLKEEKKRKRETTRMQRGILAHMGSDDAEKYQETDEIEHEVIKERNQVLRQDLGVQENQQEGTKYLERTKRAATIEVSEDCVLLAINRDTFRELFVSMLQKDIDAKVKVIMQMPFFRVHPPSLLSLT